MYGLLAQSRAAREELAAVGLDAHHRVEPRAKPNRVDQRFSGCIAATWIGSAMGAAVEGWSREQIRTEGPAVDAVQA
jgi:hypothetical protein